MLTSLAIMSMADHANKDKSNGAAASQVSQPTAKSNAFNWAGLSSELRNQIYDLCLVSKECITISVRWNRRNSISTTSRIIRRRASTFNPNLLLVNKSTYADGFVLLYRNAFRFCSSNCMKVFLCQISPSAKACIERISLFDYQLDSFALYLEMFVSSYPAPALSFNCLTGTTSLKQLTLVVDNTYLCLPSSFSLVDWKLYGQWLHGPLSSWLQAVGKEKGEKCAGVGIVEVVSLQRKTPFWERDVSDQVRARLRELLQ